MKVYRGALSFELSEGSWHFPVDDLDDYWKAMSQEQNKISPWSATSFVNKYLFTKKKKTFPVWI